MQCEFELRVITAVRSDAIPGDLRKHIDSCPACQETERLTLSFRALAMETDAVIPPVPDPSMVWNEATVEARPASQTTLYLISAAVLGAVLLAGYFIYGFFFRMPGESAGSLKRLPLGGSPFPLDSGLVILLVAVGLVLLLPQIGSSKPKKVGSLFVTM